MKVAYHFDSQAEGLSGYYGPQVENAFFAAIREPKRLSVNSKVFMGDLLMGSLAESFRKEHEFVDRVALSDAWVNGESPVWSSLNNDARELVYGNRVFVLGFEAIDDESTRELDRRLRMLDFYLGALEVDDSSALHWQLYSSMIGHFYRLTPRGISLFWDGTSEESKDEGIRIRLEGAGLGPVTYESLNSRYSIFDARHTFEEARRVALWKRRASGLLGFIAEDSVTRLSDAAPEVGERLYSALKALDTAETAEDVAHVMLSCRRLFEYVTDCILPPEAVAPGERQLGPSQYKNRLLAFVDRQQASDASVKLVSASIDMWAAQVDALYALANKGVHGSSTAAEAKRCLVRMILLLDDITALRVAPFEITVEPDQKILERLAKTVLRSDDEK